MKSIFRRCAFILLLPVLAASAIAQSPLLIYSNSLVNGFQDWSWATVNRANTSPVHSGPNSISVSAAQYTAASFYHPDLDTSLYVNLTFWINGGLGGQTLQVQGETNATAGPVLGTFPIPTLPANTWQLITVPLSSLGVAGVTNFERFWIQLVSGTTNTFYLDDIQLTAVPPPALTHITVDPAAPLRTVDRRWFGINTAIWDSDFSDPATLSLLRDMGMQFLRFPGGSASDEYNWQTDKSLTNTWSWATSFDTFAHVATNLGAQAIITANYGTGTPQLAAAWVAHSKSANYGFKYWEIGNENYGTWETDSNTLPHDAYTYATRAQSYIQQMKAADPSIKIGVVLTTGEDSSVNGYSSHPATNLTTHQTHYGWSPVLLATLKKLGVQPDFAIYHWYPEYTDNENDSALLAGTSNWARDAADLRAMITNYYGPAGTNIELLVTENNSNAGQQGKQSTSLVNGLYYADSLGQLMQTEFNSFVWWDLRNGTDLTGNMDPSIYGWRQYGDIGTVNTSGNSASNRYPAYYTMKLMRFLARPGDTVLSAASDYMNVSSYATRGTNGSLRLLVINKDPAATYHTQISLGSFAPGASAAFYSYGMPQDDANRTGVGSPDIATNYLSVSNGFTAAFAPYSAGVFVFPPAPPALAAALAPGQLILHLSGNAGAPYVLQSSPDFSHWTSVSTNLLNASSLDVTNNLSSASGGLFWRAVWMP
ncbi:MAG TPA: alpha-L-arabinofuranosidase [Verrucomicrobiae bacterium]|nr:alpha-L-arabinofuranosidase [Verrucomicrobiae bacterium]